MAADPYDTYALFYDDLNDYRRPMADRIQSAIYRYAERARTVLELGCGTGAILAALDPAYEITGLDTSRPMLDIARRRLPRGHFVQADMAAFDLGRTFDVVFSTYNSVSHLLETEAVGAAFACAARHLAPKGLWIFDVLTRERFEYLAANPWHKHLSDGSTVDLHIEHKGPDLFIWHMVRHTPGAAAEEMAVQTCAYEPETLEALLAPHFTILEASTSSDEDPGRRLYVCRKH
jgi:SAM-dependent methyltransferase